jgi:hypothetical protein
MKSEIWEKFVGLTRSAEAKSFGRTRFALGSVFLAASQTRSVCAKPSFASDTMSRVGSSLSRLRRDSQFFYRSSSLAIGKTGCSASGDFC